jgi:hypothetical protein
MAKQNNLQNSSANDQQQKQNKSQGRCRAHGEQKLVALG